MWRHTMDFHNGEMGQDRGHSGYKMELTSVKIKKAEEGEVIELEVVRSEDGDEGTGGEGESPSKGLFDKQQNRMVYSKNYCCWGERSLRH